MTDNVVILGDHAEDSRFISIERMLEQALVEVRAGQLRGKAVLLIVDKGEQGLAYNTRFRVAQMSTSEVIALLEIMKRRFVDMILGAG